MKEMKMRQTMKMKKRNEKEEILEEFVNETYPGGKFEYKFECGCKHLEAGAIYNWLSQKLDSKPKLDEKRIADIMGKTRLKVPIGYRWLMMSDCRIFAKAIVEAYDKEEL